MVSYVNPLKKPDEFELYVKKLRSLFDMHHVEFGAPANFAGFMQKLVQDRHFAMDFWAFTGTLSKKEGGELSVEQMLAVIVEGVTGGDIPDGDDGNKVLMDELATLLAGVDLYSPSRVGDAEEVAPTPAPVSPPQHMVSTRFTDMTERATRSIPEDKIPSPSSAPAPSAPGPVESASIQSSQSSSIAAVQHHIDEALMRLELKELELKEHLEDLDKKVSRIEPHLEALESKVNSTERLRSSVEQIEPPATDAFERVVRKPAENPRLVLEPTPEPTIDQHDDPPVPTLLAGYAQQGNHRSAMVFSVIVLLAIAGGVLLLQRYDLSQWQRYGAAVGESVRERGSALLEKIHRSDTAQVAANSASPNAAPNTVAASSPPAATSSGAADSGTPPPAPNASQPSASAAIPNDPPKPAPEPVTVPAGPTAHAATPLSEPHARDARPNPRSSRKTSRPTADEAEETANDAQQASAVSVAPAVMKANLVASRVPAYPEAAKADHIEGPVVVQAFISKDGFVDRVHVIEGNPRLRNAAAEAVQKWRYRPYLLNGQPVEVATTVTVDFKLDR